MRCIISKYFIKCQITVLKTSSVNRDHQATWLKSFIVVAYVVCCLRYAAYYDIGIAYHRFNIFAYLKFNILEILETFYE